MSSAGFADHNFIDLSSPKSWAMNGIAGIFCVMGEFMFLKALQEGVTGPAVAIISFNAILVSVLTWVFNGVALTSL